MADGKFVIDSKFDVDGIEKSSRDIRKEFEQVADVTAKTVNKMEAGFDDAGKSLNDLFKANVSADLVVDALKEIGKAAIEMAKESIEAAADIQASNAQFEQTFKGMENAARKSLKAIAEDTGFAATRMQDSFTKIFAFSKSVGADADTALGISDRALRAAADSAAYYDVSIEEATETLMSFIKGNYENDAALGIAATETTRNAKANEMYAVSFDKLSESQKVDVLLAMVEAGNEASGALGQAAREADAWTNVMGELQEAWRQLLGVFGSPIIEGLTPIIQGITKELQKLTEVTAGDNLAESMESFRQSIHDIDDEFNSTSQAIERNAAMAETYVSKLQELEASGLSTAESQREYANAVSLLNDLYPELNLQIEEQSGLLDANSKAQLKSLDSLKKKAKYSAQEKKYTAALEAQADAILAVQDAEKELLSVQTQRREIENELNAATERTGMQLVDLYHNRAEAAKLLTKEEMDLLDQLILLQQEEIRLGTGISEGNASIAEQDVQLQNLNAELQETAAGLGEVVTAEGEAAASAEETAAAQEKLIAKYQEAKDAARDSIDSQIGYFDKVDAKSKTSAQNIVENWRSQQQAFANYDANLRKALEMGYADGMIKQLADGSTESMMILEALVNSHSMSVDEINAEWEKTNQIRDALSGTIAEVKEDLTVMTEEVNTAVDQAITTATDGADSIAEGASEKAVTLILPVTEALEQIGSDAKSTLDTIEGYVTESFERISGTVSESIEGLDIGSIIEDIEELKGNLETLPSDVGSTVNSMYSESGTAAANALSDAANTIQSTVFTPITESGEASGEAVGEAFDDAANTMKTALADMGPWFDSNVSDPIKSSMESVTSSMESSLSSMQSATSSAWAAMVSTVQNAIGQMQAAINSITGKTVYVNVEKTGSGANLISYSGYDGKAYSPEMDYVSTAAYTPATLDITPQTPYVASGAVIPPMAIPATNSKFAAKDDNMDMIVQKLSEVIGDTGGAIEIHNRLEIDGPLAPMIRLLYPEFKAEAKRRGKSIAVEYME